MQVKVLFFSVLREKVGARELYVDVPDQATGATLLDQLAVRFAALDPYRHTIRLAVNEEYVTEEVYLFEGAEVALITPVSGG